KLGYWLVALRANFAYAPMATGLFTVFILSLVRRPLNRPLSTRLSTLDACSAIAILQIVLALASFSAGDNDENRYLFPIGPYFVVLIVWALGQFMSNWLSLGIILLAVGQAVFANSQALTLNPVVGDTSPWLTPIQPDATRARELDRLVDTICMRASVG